MNERRKSDWSRQLKRRFCTRWWLKTTGIVVYIGLFMVVYFTLLEHPQFAVTVMPLTAFDRWIGLVPWAVVPYVSLWVYIGLAPGLLYPGGEVKRYLLAATLLCLIGCGIFLLWPTAVPDPGIDWARWPLLAMLKTTDAAGNAFPSLHVAFSVLTALWLRWLLRQVRAPGWLNGINLSWCGLIVWSTMATRQHVFLDVIAGGLLGGMVALACLPGKAARQDEQGLMADS